MFDFLKKSAAAAAITLFALPASAATFGFTSGANGANGNYNGNYSATVDGITVDVTAGIYDGTDLFGTNDAIVDADCSDNFFCTKQVNKANEGLGVSAFFQSDEINGAVDDLITFTFSKAVDFSSLVFSAVNPSDDFDLFIDGALVSEENNIASANPFGPFGTGTSFSIGADAFNDSFRIASIEVAAVPLPASALLLLAGIGGLGAMRRRKS